MELKVWVEGIQRVICGVSEDTTCHDIIVALAQATGKTGRFSLVEKWRDNESLLAPSDYPLRALHKWGEYASDVHFILKQSDIPDCDKKIDRLRNSLSPLPLGGATVKRNLTFSGAHNTPVFPDWKTKPKRQVDAITEETNDGYNVNEEINRSKPRQPPPYHKIEKMLQDNFHKGQLNSSSPNYGSLERKSKKMQNERDATSYSMPNSPYGEWHSTRGKVETHEYVVQQPQPVRKPQQGDTSYNSLERNPQRKVLDTVSVSGPEVNYVYNSLERKSRMMTDIKSQSPYNSFDRKSKRAPISYGSEVDDISVTPERTTSRNTPERNTVTRDTPERNTNTPDGDLPTIFRQSPDGRSPPGSQSPVKSRKEIVAPGIEIEEFDLDRSLSEEHGMQEKFISFKDKIKGNKVLPADLVKLVKLQKEKMDSQESQLTVLNAEIQYLEESDKEISTQLNRIQEEIRDNEITDKNLAQEISENDSVRWVDEIEVQKQTENTLQAELTLLRSKLANCESDLLQCKNKICTLTQEIAQEKRDMEKMAEERKAEETKIKEDISQLKRRLNEAEKDGKVDGKALHYLNAEIKEVEEKIEEKKKEIEQIEKDIKEANLKHFIKVKPEKQDSDENPRSSSPARPGSIRKMMGSPQLLSEAVPTSRNPHGLWV